MILVRRALILDTTEVEGGGDRFYTRRPIIFVVV